MSGPHTGVATQTSFTDLVDVSALPWRTLAATEPLATAPTTLASLVKSAAIFCSPFATLLCGLTAGRRTSEWRVLWVRSAGPQPLAHVSGGAQSEQVEAVRLRWTNTGAPAGGHGSNW